MRITTKGRSTVNAMIDLAARSTTGPVSLSSISLRRGISLSYLEQLFGKLRRSGLVLSMRGPGGGYSLALPQASITVADIVAAVDGIDHGALEDATGERAESTDRCDASTLWNEVKSKMNQLLGAITLEKLVEEQLANGFLTLEVQPLRRGISSEPVVKPVRTNAANSVFAFAATLSKGSQATGPIRSRRAPT